MGCRARQAWFARHGSAAVLVVRLTPFARMFMSVTAGLLGGPLGVYTAPTLLRSAIWCCGFATVGRGLGADYEQADSVAHGVELGAAMVVVVHVVAVSLRRRRGRLSRHGAAKSTAR